MAKASLRRTLTRLAVAAGAAALLALSTLPAGAQVPPTPTPSPTPTPTPSPTPTPTPTPTPVPWQAPVTFTAGLEPVAAGTALVAAVDTDTLIAERALSSDGSQASVVCDEEEEEVFVSLGPAAPWWLPSPALRANESRVCTLRTAARTTTDTPPFLMNARDLLSLAHAASAYRPDFEVEFALGSLERSAAVIAHYLGNSSAHWRVIADGDDLIGQYLNNSNTSATIYDVNYIVRSRGDWKQVDDSALSCSYSELDNSTGAHGCTQQGTAPLVLRVPKPANYASNRILVSGLTGYLELLSANQDAVTVSLVVDGQTRRTISRTSNGWPSTGWLRDLSLLPSLFDAPSVVELHVNASVGDGIRSLAISNGASTRGYVTLRAVGGVQRTLTDVLTVGEDHTLQFAITSSSMTIDLDSTSSTAASTYSSSSYATARFFGDANAVRLRSIEHTVGAAETTWDFATDAVAYTSTAGPYIGTVSSDGAASLSFTLHGGAGDVSIGPLRPSSVSQLAAGAGDTATGLAAVLGEDLAYPVEDPFAVGDGYGFPLSLFVGGLTDDTFPPMLAALTIVLTAACVAWLGVYGVLRNYGVAHAAGVLVAAGGLAMTPLPSAVTVMIVMLFIAVAALTRRAFTRVA